MTPPPPNVTVPPDIFDRPQEERIQLALAAIQGSGTKLNGDPCYSACQAEQHFGVSRTTLGRRLQGVSVV
jgi:helix-turn-helix, Psq domain